MVEARLHPVGCDPEAMMLAGDHQLRGQVKGQSKVSKGQPELRQTFEIVEDLRMRVLAVP